MNQLFIGGIGSTELILIVVVLLLMFGGSKLPDLMKGAGRGIREFKDAVNGTEKKEETKDEPKEATKSDDTETK